MGTLGQIERPLGRPDDSHRSPEPGLERRRRVDNKTAHQNARNADPLASDKPGLRKVVDGEQHLFSRLEDDGQKLSFKVRVGLRQAPVKVRLAPFTVTYTAYSNHQKSPRGEALEVGELYIF